MYKSGQTTFTRLLTLQIGQGPGSCLGNLPFSLSSRLVPGACLGGVGVLEVSASYWYSFSLARAIDVECRWFELG